MQISPPGAGRRPLEELKSSEPPEQNTCFNQKASLTGMATETLVKVFSYLHASNIAVCKRINKRICAVVEGNNLLQLAIWKYIPPSVRAFYTREHYQTRHRDYLIACQSNNLINSFDKISKSNVFFSPLLFFSMLEYLVKADRFSCIKKELNSIKETIHSENVYCFNCIASEYSLCLLIKVDPNDRKVCDIVGIDIHGQQKTSQIKCDSKILDAMACKNGNYITILLQNGYLEINKLESGQWQSKANFKCDVIKRAYMYKFSDDHRSLIFKSSTNTLLIWKLNDKNEWQQWSSIYCITDNISHIEFSYNGNFLLILDSENYHLWKIDKGCYKKYHTAKKFSQGCLFSPDGRFLIGHSNDGFNSSIRLFALGGKQVCEKSFTLTPESMASHSSAKVWLSPDDCSTVILGPDTKNTLLIYQKNQAGNGYIHRNSIAADLSFILHFSFSQNGNFFIFYKDKNMLEIWKKSKGIWMQQMEAAHQSEVPVEPEHFNSNSSCLVTVPDPVAGIDDKGYFPVNVLKLNDKGEWISEEIIESGQVKQIRWLPDNNNFITILEDGSINRWTIIPESPF